MNSSTEQLDLFPTSTALPPVPALEAITCARLDDAPDLSGPLMPSRMTLLLPPVRFDLLAQAYDAAQWGWSLSMEDRQAYYARQEPDKTKEELLIGSMLETKIPSPEDLAAVITRDVQSMSTLTRPGDYTQGGGLLLFRSRSGRLGLAVHSPLGEHYARLKASA